MSVRFSSLGASLLMLAGAAGACNAGVIFSDNFDNENKGKGSLNFLGFTQWSVSGGTVDLIGKGYFDFFPKQGLFIDLDGSTSKAGRLASLVLSLDPGAYELSFSLAGNQRGYANDSVTVSLGSYSEVFNLPSSQAMTPYSRSVTINATTQTSLVFQNSGGDNVGALLDDVRLLSVPSPAGGVVLAGVGMGLMLRRRR